MFYKTGRGRTVLLMGICIVLLFVGILIFFSMQRAAIISKIPIVQGDTQALDIPTWETVLENINTDQGPAVFNFKDKAVISNGKYGFRKKVTYTKETNIWMEIYGSDQIQCKDVRAGVYQDKDLSQPVEETLFVDWGDESYAEAELGIPREISDERDGVIMVPPGTYYIGLFTSNPKDHMQIEYQSWRSDILPEYEVPAGKDFYFFTEGGKKETYLKLKPQTSMMTVQLSVDSADIQLCDYRKRGLSKEIKMEHGRYDCKFEVDPNQTYYLKVYNVTILKETMPYSIIYQ